jgi:hypothetical protein
MKYDDQYFTLAISPLKHIIYANIFKNPMQILFVHIKEKKCACVYTPAIQSFLLNQDNEYENRYCNGRETSI